jgi:hypothetical protein
MEKEIMRGREEAMEYPGHISNNYALDGMTVDELRNKLLTDSEFQKKYGFALKDYETLYTDGCMLFSVKYGLENITGKKYNPVLLNEYLVEKGHYTGDLKNLLSNELMAQIWNELSGGLYEASLVNEKNPKPSLQQLLQFDRSGKDYIVHLRINNGNHSVMFQNIVYERNGKNEIIGIKGVNVANPALGNDSVNGEKFYSFDQITRWDIFQITPPPHLKLPSQK